MRSHIASRIQSPLPLLCLLNLVGGIRRDVQPRTVRIHRERQNRRDQNDDEYAHRCQTPGAMVLLRTPTGAPSTF